MQLSPHFSLEELTASETASRRGLVNTPTEPQLRNLRMLALELEKVRDILGGRPIHINSGYRSPLLNRAVGGTKVSAHMDGLAADIVCPSFGSPLEVCAEIASSGLSFDQCIFEFDSWCHFAIAHAGLIGRRQLLTIDRTGTRDGLPE